MTRATLVTAVLLVLVGVAAAQAPPGQTPLPGFGMFRCACQQSIPGLVPTPSLIAPPSSNLWNGMVYALSAADAQLKAKTACIADSQGRGNQAICDTCRCFK